MSNKIEKPYVLRAAEFIYKNIIEIKKQNPEINNIQAFEIFMTTEEYDNLSSGKFHDEWFLELKKNKFVDTITKKKINEEFGDLVFSIVNLGRHLGVDSEEALKQTNRKFIKRFNFVEDKIRSQGGEIENTTLEEMETLWQQAKNS